MAELEDVIFLSVPVTTSAHSCERLRDIVSVALKDQKTIVVLTHNIELLRARKLTSAEAVRVLGHIQDHEAESVARAQAELQGTVYQRVRNILEAHDEFDPAVAVSFMESLRQHIARIEDDDAEENPSDGSPDAPDNRH